MQRFKKQPQPVRATQNLKLEKRTTQIAQAIWQRRDRLNIAGDPQTDWDTATEIAKSPVRRFIFARAQNLDAFWRSQAPTPVAVRFVIWKVPQWFVMTFPKLEIVKLLAVPLVLAISTSVITTTFQQERDQITTLDDYFDQLDKLTSERDLLEETPKSGAIVLARGRTVATLRKLDSKRRQQLLAFLQASGLVQGEEPVISFENTDLEGMNLSGVDLRGVRLAESNLKKVDLEGANLKGANLKGIVLEEAGLRVTKLEDADLRGSFLVGADLEGADLEGVALKCG